MGSQAAEAEAVDFLIYDRVFGSHEVGAGALGGGLLAGGLQRREFGVDPVGQSHLERIEGYPAVATAQKILDIPTPERGAFCVEDDVDEIAQKVRGLDIGF